MAKTISSEMEKAQKRGAQVVNGFTGQIRSTTLNTLEDGDIITFPTDLTGKVIVEEVKIRGVVQTDDDGNPRTMEYILVDVERKGKHTVAQFFPSFFTKSREVADADDKPTGEYKRASGAVVDFVQDGFADDDIDKAILAVAAKGKVKVTLESFKGIEYGTNRAKKMTVPVFEWAA